MSLGPTPSAPRPRPGSRDRGEESPASSGDLLAPPARHQLAAMQTPASRLERRAPRWHDPWRPESLADHHDRPSHPRPPPPRLARLRGPRRARARPRAPAHRRRLCHLVELARRATWPQRATRPPHDRTTRRRPDAGGLDGCDQRERASRSGLAARLRWGVVLTPKRSAMSRWRTRARQPQDDRPADTPLTCRQRWAGRVESSRERRRVVRWRSVRERGAGLPTRGP
jgi:hypothetical protein